MNNVKLDESKSLIFLGDHHGNWNELFYLIRIKNLDNCSIISVGDLGIGFKRISTLEIDLCKNLNEEFKNRNINFYGIRGNHDNPIYFKGNDKICFENFELIEDYSIMNYGNKIIQLIGGAVSIDRTGRRVGISYWEDEGLVFDKNKCQKVDILVTHTAPSWCFPQQFNEMVYGWAREDAYLLEDLTDERSVMDEIFKLCKPHYHVYGHFHDSWAEIVNGCKHNLLNINEFYEYRQ
jgi:DNA repair exonuclease SbcCD nuclease subunit